MRINKMKINLFLAFAGLVCLSNVSFAENEMFVAGVASSWNYDVKRPAIEPDWQVSDTGRWTMDYEGALALAKAQRRYTIVFFTAMWWCPHCQDFENRVLGSEEWKKFSAEMYEVAMDYPYRDGVSNWCWLWDEAFLAKAGHAGDYTWAAQEIVRRYEIQNAYSATGAKHQYATNVVWSVAGGVTNGTFLAEKPISDYYRVGYPTLILLDPDGVELGRFSYSRKNFADLSDADTIKAVIGKLTDILHADELRLQKSSSLGVIAGTSAVQYVGWIQSNNVLAGSALVKVAKARTDRTTGKQTAKVVVTLKLATGKRVKLSGVASVGSQESVTVSGGGYSGELTIGAEGVAGTIGGLVVQGARKGRAVPTGRWSFALQSMSTSSSFATGYSAFVLTTNAKGAAKVTALLADGVKITASGTVSVGDDVSAIPVMVTKAKESFAFVVWIKDGEILSVNGSTDWQSSTGGGFSTAWFVAAAGKSGEPSACYLNLPDLVPASVKGMTIDIARLPLASELAFNGKRWTGSGDAAVKINYTSSTGIFKGSFNSFTTTGKKVKTTVVGVLIDGNGYGSAVIKNAGSARFSLSADSCDACGM